ncbi:hypothetical protein BUALT_Bualt12G0087400 [Buddleja alternifolia]|uniref:Uncharacterized protein n=1 Tax=Buddleja alternifolia TaxID=168488 RepID=A0AAV6WWE9_9LAMI|nr:hypothetical protein BUALT_Bualt12G0087400 [Buddleja alternifolia]
MDRTNNINSFPSIANSNGKLRIQPYFEKQGVIYSCPKFIHNNNVQTENDKYSSSLILAAPSNPGSTLTLEKAIEYELNHVKLEKKKNELYKLKEVEKIVNKDDHGSSSRAQEIQDSSFKKFVMQSDPSHGFYQLGLQYLQKQPGSHQFCKRQLPSSLFVQSELRIAGNFVFEQCSEDQASDFKSNQPVDLGTYEENQEEANIDQYLNFEAQNAHPSSG